MQINSYKFNELSIFNQNRTAKKTFEKENLSEVLKNHQLIENYVNVSYLDLLYKDFINETNESNDVMSIWMFANFSLWLKYTNICS